VRFKVQKSAHAETLHLLYRLRLRGVNHPTVLHHNRLRLALYVFSPLRTRGLAAFLEEPVGDFLILLDDITASAAPDLEAVGDEIALKVPAVLNLAALDNLGYPVETETRSGPEAKAGGVDRVPVGELRVFPKAVMRLAESYTGAEVCDKACIDGVEAPEEVGVPWPGVVARGARDRIWLRNGAADSLHPVVDFIALDNGILRLLRHFG